MAIKNLISEKKISTPTATIITQGALTSEYVGNSLDVHVQSTSDHEQPVYATDIYETIRIILIKIQESSYLRKGL